MTEAQCNVEPKCSQTKKKRKRNRKKKSPKTKEEDQINFQGDAYTIKDNSLGPSSCDDSLVDNNAKTDLKIAPLPILSRSQKKRKKRRKKQMLNVSVNADETHDSCAELESVEEQEEEENALISAKQSDSLDNPISMVIKHENNGDAFLVLADKKKRKRKRKKRKLNTSVSTDETHELDSINGEQNAQLSEKQSDFPSSSSSMVIKHDNNGDASVILVDQRKRKRKRKKQKLNTSASTDEAHVSRAELGLIQEEENALISEKLSDSQSNLSSMVNKHDSNSDVSLILVDQEQDSYEVHSVELSDNEVEGVQIGEHAASVKVVKNGVAKKNSSNCSGVDFTCPESKDLILIKKNAGLDVEQSVQQVLHPLVGARVGYADKKLLVLDVNGLLADIVLQRHRSYKADIIISRKSVFKRPFCDDFLQFCFEKFNVGVWSSRTKKNVDAVINFLIRDSRHKLLFVWHQSHCTKTGFTTVENSSKPLVLKELRKLWDKLGPGLPWNKGEYNESNTLLLDDSPYKALRNPANTAIFPHSYQYKDAEDCSLGPGGDLRVYLERLAEASNVQEYVAQHPFGQRAITESNPSWGFYQKILGVESCQSQEVAGSSGLSTTRNL